MKKIPSIAVLLMTGVMATTGCLSSGKSVITVAVNSKFNTKKFGKLAILYKPYADLNWSAKSYRDSVEVELMSMGFQMIERSHVDKIMKEQKFASTGAVDFSEAANIGKIAGANAIVLLRHKRVDRKYSRFGYIKIVDVETGVILVAAAWEKGERKNVPPGTAARELVNAIGKKIQ